MIIQQLWIIRSCILAIFIVIRKMISNCLNTLWHISNVTEGKPWINGEHAYKEISTFYKKYVKFFNCGVENHILGYMIIQFYLHMACCCCMECCIAFKRKNLIFNKEFVYWIGINNGNDQKYVFRKMMKIYNTIFFLRCLVFII